MIHSHVTILKCDMIQAISGAPWRSEGIYCSAYLWNLPHLASLLYPPSVHFLNHHLGGNMHLKYQEPVAGMLSYKRYFLRGIYIYIAIISDVNDKAI